MRLRLISVLSVLLLILPLSAMAQVNGDFEAGGTGWTVTLPNATWSGTFPVAGGNPNGYAQLVSPFGNSGGIAHVEQTFDCGSPPFLGICQITFDLRCVAIDAGTGTGRVKVFHNGNLVLTRACDEVVNPPYVTLELPSVPCGQQKLELCLEVDAGNNGWQACFDNVRAVCIPPLPTEQKTWGALKAVYFAL